MRMDGNGNVQEAGVENNREGISGRVVRENLSAEGTLQRNSKKAPALAKKTKWVRVKPRGGVSLDQRQRRAARGAEGGRDLE